MQNDLLTDVAEIGRRATAMKTPLIVIDGLCGSGKTTLADSLSSMLQAPVVHMDDFFLPFSLRTPQRLSQPGGNVDYERFEREVLPRIGSGAAFAYGKFHCSDGTVTPAVCPPARVRIVEGTYSMHPRFMPVWQEMGALTVFASVPAQEQLRRIALRNPRLLERFEKEWIPMENSYFSAFNVEEAAMIKWTSFTKMSQK